MANKDLRAKFLSMFLLAAGGAAVATAQSAPSQAVSEIGYITDASGGQHPIRISRTPQADMVPALCGGDPCFAQLPFSSLPFDPVLPGPRQGTNATNEPASATITANASAVVLLPKPVTADSKLAPPFAPNTKSEPVQPRPQPYVNPCDAACQQHNFNTGYAEGQAIGSAIVGVIDRHRMGKFCKANPLERWNWSNGTFEYCSPQAEQAAKMRPRPLSSVDAVSLASLDEIRDVYRESNDVPWLRKSLDFLRQRAANDPTFMQDYRRMVRIPNYIPGGTPVEVIGSFYDLRESLCSEHPWLAIAEMDGSSKPCLAQETETPSTATIPQTPNRAQVSSQPVSSNGHVTGLYQSDDCVSSCGYLRLYSDGTVIGISVAGAGTPDEVNEIDRWFHRPYENSGSYKIEGSTIQFSTQSSRGTVDYKGEVNGTTLELDSFSHINGHQWHETYHRARTGEAQ